jgi:hypothetical protein|tara:strand:+ start:5994 stop:7007 length:1014 start_codon:yes stop_codon:yes gene_type:complete
MANFAIFRYQKLKSTYSVRRSFKHAYREQDTPNADDSRYQNNQTFGAKNTEQALKLFRELLPEKLRKNGVVCVESLITASPAWFENKTIQEQNDYFKDSVKHLKSVWGNDNVICGGIHRDETTPHMYVYIVPKDEKTGRLNCRKWLGEKGALSKAQTDFHEMVGIKHGLERGREGSKAKHKTLKKYYAELNADALQIESIKPPKLSIIDYAAAAAGKKNSKILENERLAALAAKAATIAKREKKSKAEQLKALEVEQKRINDICERVNKRSDELKVKDDRYSKVDELLSNNANEKVKFLAEIAQLKKEKREATQKIESLVSVTQSDFTERNMPKPKP